MTDLEKENQELKEQIQRLKESNNQKIDTISKLNAIGINLSSQKDTSSILENILLTIKEFTNADAGTIYLVDGNKLTFKHILNSSLNIEKKQKIDSQNEEKIWNYLEIKEENKHLLAVRSALSKKTIRINNLDSDDNTVFEEKTGYIDKTMLVVPMLMNNGDLIGIIQLINKKFHNETISFTDEDESLARSLASQASVAVHKFKQNDLIVRQSKLAAMGEMIDAIAHQWNQPLSIINTKMIGINLKLDLGKNIDDEMLRDTATMIQEQISHLSSTLSEFRSFYRLDKEKIPKNLSQTIDKALHLTKDDIVSNNIQTEIIGDKELRLEIIENEFIHIFINLIGNAKDAFKSNDTKNKKISFHIQELEDFIYIDILDTAGGIAESIIADIFKANFTTKKIGEGTGIGLYLSTQIAEKNNAKLLVENIEDGARFRLKIRK